MLLTSIISREDIIPNFSASGKEEALRKFAKFFVERGLYEREESIFKTLYDREKLGSTGIGGGIAIPHGKLPDLDDVLAIFARSKEGVDFESLDGKPVYLFFVLLAPESSPGKHLRVIAKISKMLKDQEFKEKLINADDDELYDILKEEDERTS